MSNMIDLNDPIPGGANNSTKSVPRMAGQGNSNASINPLDALALACEHHEETARVERAVQNNSTMGTSMNVVPQQLTPASTIRTVSVESTNYNSNVKGMAAKSTRASKPKAKKTRTSPSKKRKTPAKVKVSKAASQPVISPNPPTPTSPIKIISSAITDVPTASSRDFEITNSDVLCGRGGLTNHHPGNVLFRNLVKAKQPVYVRATKREKSGVSVEIVSIIRRLNPPGRFLKKDPKNPKKWVDIGDQKAREKTSQALREGAPAVREELTSRSRDIQSVSALVGLGPLVGHHAAGSSVACQPPQPFLPGALITHQPNLLSQGSDARARVVSSDSDSSFPPSTTPANIITPTSLTATISGSTASTAEEISLSSCAKNSGKDRSKLPRMKLIKARMGDVSN